MIRGMIRPHSSDRLFLKGPTGPWHSKVRFRYDSGYVSGMIRGMIRACNCFLKNRKILLQIHLLLLPTLSTCVIVTPVADSLGSSHK